MSILEILVGAVFVAVVGLGTRRAVARSARREPPAEPAPLLGVVLPTQRDGSDLDDKITTI